MKNGKQKIESKLFLISYFLFLIFCFSLLSRHFSPLYAATPQKELTKIQKKLKKGERKVKAAIKKEKSILSELEKINRTLKKKQGELRYYTKRFLLIRLKIKRIKKEIIILNNKLEKRKKYLKGRLKVLYKQQPGERALILISAKDYQDLIRRSKYISSITHYDNKLIKTYSEGIKKLSSKKREMEALQKKAAVDKDNVQKKTKELRAARRKKNNLFVSIRSKRSYYEKMVKELKGSSKKLRAMIKRLEKMKHVPLVSGKGFRALKGHLPWPVNGKVIIPYGKYNHPKFNIAVFKNGVEIKAKSGAIARAISEGRVVYAEWFKGYGQLLIINHGGAYHSLYGHLAEIFHKTGAIIKNGTIIGKIGESGLLDVPTLYFEIRYKGKPLNPIKWLKRQ